MGGGRREITSGGFSEVSSGRQQFLPVCGADSRIGTKSYIDHNDSVQSTTQIGRWIHGTNGTRRIQAPSSSGAIWPAELSLLN